MENLVVYKGIPCKLLAAEEPFPTRLQILSPDSIPQALKEGFSYWGYPTEIMKEVTPEELVSLQDLGRFPPN